MGYKDSESLATFIERENRKGKSPFLRTNEDESQVTLDFTQTEMINGSIQSRFRELVKVILTHMQAPNLVFDLSNTKYVESGTFGFFCDQRELNAVDFHIIPSSKVRGFLWFKLFCKQEEENPLVYEFLNPAIGHAPDDFGEEPELFGEAI